MNLPEGSWVGMFKITDDKLWNDYVKTGKVQGFSIEGYFVDKSQKFTKELTDEEAKIQEVIAILREYQNCNNTK